MISGINEKPPISVLGVGNILMTDEGLGATIVTELEKEYSFSDDVQLLDGGTMGMELLHYIGDATRILLVDAINYNKEPGTVYKFTHQDLDDYFNASISVHEVGIQDILRIRIMQENPFEEAVVIGAEPESLEIGLELTPTLRAKVPELKKLIIDQLREWGVEVTKK